MPMQAMCSLGRLAPRSALPSLVQTTKPPVSATAKLAPVMPASASKEIRPRVAAHGFRRGSARRIARLGADRSRKHSRDIAAQLVNRGNDDMTRRLVVELLDAFAQIGLDYLDAARLEERAHVAFVGQHRLALDQRLGAARRKDVVDDLVVLAGVARPMHLHAIVLGVALRTVRDNRPGAKACAP